MDLISQSFPIAISIAFVFGLLSFLSPCVLPIVPAYLAFMSGVSLGQIRVGKEATKIRKAALFFVLGLSTVFLLLAMTANLIASEFLKYQALITRISGLVIIIFGLHFLGVFKLSFLHREWRINIETEEKSILSAYLFGLAFAFGWSPCLGPVLSAILTMISGQENLNRGLLLMLAYALGLGIPFIISALFIEKFLKSSRKVNRILPIIEKAIAILLIIVGILMLTGSFTDMAFWLNEHIPFLKEFG